MLKNTYGNDISHHQNKDAVRQLLNKGKSKFIIVRATIGSQQVDGHFKFFIDDILRNKIPYGFYSANYCKNIAEAEAEAEAILDTMKRYGATEPDLPIFFDWEYFSAEYVKNNFGITVGPKLLQDMALAFVNTIRKQGYRAGIYLNKDFWNRYYGDQFFKDHPEVEVWYARPGYAKPDKTCDIWQYGSNYGLDDFGYRGNIDKDLLMKDYNDEEPIEQMKPLSNEPIRMKIGYASAGDVKKIMTKLEGLGIEAEEKDGYIITSLMSRGDQCYIMIDCNALGIHYEIYNPGGSCDEYIEKIAELEARIQELEKANEGLKQDNTQLNDKYTQLKGILYSAKETLNLYKE